MSSESEAIAANRVSLNELDASSVGDPDTEDQPVGDPASLSKGLLRPRTLISFAFAMGILIFFVQRMNLDLAAVVSNIRSANLILLATAIIVYVCTIVLAERRDGARCSPWQAPENHTREPQCPRSAISRRC